MIKALISMKQSRNNHGALMDTLESSYADFFNSIGVELFPLLNKPIDNQSLIAKMSSFDLIILSGSGDIDKDQELRDALERKLITTAIKMRIPVLGICRGAQMLSLHYGFNLVRDYSNFRSPGKNHQILFRERLYTVNHYHDYNISYKSNDPIPTNLEIGLDPITKNIEILISKEERILGLQWHPERMTVQKESLLLAKELINEVCLIEKDA